MCDIPGRPVISNCGFYTENISAFLDHQLKPIAMQVKSYVKDTNDFPKKLRVLPDLPKESMIFTINLVDLYPSIPKKEGLRFFRNVLERRSNKKLILNNVQVIRGTAIGTKIAPLYAITYIAALEEGFLETLLTKKPWLR